MDIEYPTFGTIIVEGIRYDHDVVIDGGVVTKRDKGPSRSHGSRGGHTPLSADEALPWPVTGALVIGTGHSGRLPVLDDILEAAASRRIELVVAATADACAVLRQSPPNEVHAVLHVTC